jgi:hypothetical protein
VRCKGLLERFLLNRFKNNLFVVEAGQLVVLLPFLLRLWHKDKRRLQQSLQVCLLMVMRAFFRVPLQIFSWLHLYRFTLQLGEKLLFLLVNALRFHVKGNNYTAWPFTIDDYKSRLFLKS